MTIREAISQQLKSIKNRSLKEQLSYFWEYYGIKTICLLLVLALGIAFLVTMLTRKDTVFSAVFFGADALQADYLTQFSQACGIDTDAYEVSVTCYPDIRMEQQITPDIYDSMQAFTAMVSARTVDAFAGNTELFLYYAYMEYAVDLRTVLTGEELERLTPCLYYIDMALIRQQEEADDGYASAYANHPDPTKPEEMTDPVPVGISLAAAGDAFGQAYAFCDDALIGICANTEQPENALSFLRYILQ